MVEASAEIEDEMLSKFSNVLHQFKDFTTHHHKLQAIRFFRFFVKCSTLSLLFILGLYHYKSGIFEYNTYVGLHLAVLIVCILNSARQLKTDRRLGTYLQDISDGFEGMTEVLLKWCDTNNPNFAKFVKLLIKEFNSRSNIDLKSNDLISLVLFEVILWFTNTTCFVINVFQQRQLHFSILIFIVITLVTITMEILLNVITFKSHKINENINDKIKNMLSIIDKCGEVQYHTDSYCNETDPEMADVTNKDSVFIKTSSSLHDFQGQNIKKVEKDQESPSSESESVSAPEDGNKNSISSISILPKIIVSNGEAYDTQESESAKERGEDFITLKNCPDYKKDVHPYEHHEQQEEKIKEENSSQSSENENVPEPDSDHKTSMTSTFVSTEVTMSEAYDSQQSESAKEKADDFSTLKSCLDYDTDVDSHALHNQKEMIKEDHGFQSSESENVSAPENDNKSSITSTSVSAEATVSKNEAYDIQQSESVKEKAEDFNTLKSCHGYDTDVDSHALHKQQEETIKEGDGFQSPENGKSSAPENDNESFVTSTSVSTVAIVSKNEDYDGQQSEFVKKKAEDFSSEENFHGHNTDVDPHVLHDQQEEKIKEEHGSQSPENENVSETENVNKSSVTSTLVSTEAIILKREAFDNQQGESVKERGEDFSTSKNCHGYDGDVDLHIHHKQQEEKVKEYHGSQSFENKNKSAPEIDNKSSMTSTSASTEATVSKSEAYVSQKSESVKEKAEDFSTLKSSHGCDTDVDSQVLHRQPEQMIKEDHCSQTSGNENVSEPESDNKSTMTFISASAEATVSESRTYNTQQNEFVKQEVENISKFKSFHDRVVDPRALHQQQEEKIKEEHVSQSPENENLSSSVGNKKNSRILSSVEKISEKYDAISTAPMDSEFFGPFMQEKHVEINLPESDTTDESGDEAMRVKILPSCSPKIQRKDTDHRKSMKQSRERKMEITYGKLGFHMDLYPDSEVELKFKLSGKSMKMKTTVAEDVTHKRSKKE